MPFHGKNHTTGLGYGNLCRHLSYSASCKFLSPREKGDVAASSYLVVWGRSGPNVQKPGLCLRAVATGSPASGPLVTPISGVKAWGLDSGFLALVLCTDAHKAVGIQAHSRLSCRFH